ncbi:MAG: glycine cleavage system protein GcvH [candidate division Zixibacteria bacterium]|nr:glycine cleavage system protein GcvH [candidate division Zixibacteria bacterium]MDD5426648.1 glycine cleavage system protein GcvH [candidate division Zixibacteria bacterium]
MNVPVNLKYTREHEWVKVEGNVATVGITDWAQGELGDIVFVELPEVGTRVVQMQSFGTIEAVKAVSDLFSPVSGEVVEVNGGLQDEPMLINRDPYGEGWMIKVEVSNAEELEQLLDAGEYKGILGE